MVRKGSRVQIPEMAPFDSLCSLVVNHQLVVRIEWHKVANRIDTELKTCSMKVHEWTDK